MNKVPSTWGTFFTSRRILVMLLQSMPATARPALDALRVSRSLAHKRPSLLENAPCWTQRALDGEVSSQNSLPPLNWKCPLFPSALRLLLYIAETCVDGAAPHAGLALLGRPRRGRTWLNRIA